jgi:hypothetical protein
MFSISSTIWQWKAGVHILTYCDMKRLGILLTIFMWQNDNLFPSISAPVSTEQEYSMNISLLKSGKQIMDEYLFFQVHILPYIGYL